MKTETVKIGGMTCINCQMRIEKMLKGTAGIESVAVSYASETAIVTYDEALINCGEIVALIESLGYTVQNGGKKATVPGKAGSLRPVGYLVIILALYMLMRQFGISTLATAFPLARVGMGYGMLFVIGLITSVHCAAMCGGINLSQCLPASADTAAAGPAKKRAALLPAILYNGGRVISYTVIGALVGALGSVVTFTGAMQGMVQLAAGVFMVIMGVNMLGVFPGLRRFNLHLPRIFGRKIDDAKAANRSPLVIGLLNGLMPCGPLQAMQLYALSTGSAIAGGVSMFLFSLGTVPLMFGIGALGSFLTRAKGGRVWTARVMKGGAILVAVLGLTMFSNGWNLSGFSLPSIMPAMASTARQGGASAGGAMPVIANGVQIVNSTLSGGRYPAIMVQAGLPVRWTINAPAGSINGCNNRMIIREYGIQHTFKSGDNIIEFTPTRVGKVPYSCWMGMIRSSITVLEEGQSIADVPVPSTAPVPAGVDIPTDTVAFSEVSADRRRQIVSINLTDDGFFPAVVVMQKGIPTQWGINNDSLDEGNSELVFPLYYAKIPMINGENPIQLRPSEDFEFSTTDNVFYGYVKVVDDINNVDVDAIKSEVAGYETQIYPAAYFEDEDSGGCC